MKKHAAALFINVLNAHPATMTAVKSSASGFKFLYDFFLLADERCCTRLQSHKMMVLISFFFFFFFTFWQVLTISCGVSERGSLLSSDNCFTIQ